MGKKRIIIKILIILLVIIILLILLNINKKTQDDYFEDIIPEEEISEEQERKTMITLYFKNKITGDLEKETRIIDVKNLMESPYKKLLELLIEGTKNGKPGVKILPPLYAHNDNGEYTEEIMKYFS